VFFQKLDFLLHLDAGEKSKWFQVAKVFAQDPRVVYIKGLVQFQFCKNSPPSVWVFPIAKKKEKIAN
jgi:hypothetical protein